VSEHSTCHSRRCWAVRSAPRSRWSTAAWCGLQSAKTAALWTWKRMSAVTSNWLMTAPRRCVEQTDCAGVCFALSLFVLQVMTADDIHSLRAAGAHGDDIVSALVANSATFDAKTAFSQEKYKAKKKRIHCPRITAYKPTSARVCAAFFSKVCVPCSPIRGADLHPPLTVCVS
jgi:Gcd10p family